MGFVLRGLVLLGAAVVCAAVSNALAGPERKLRWFASADSAASRPAVTPATPRAADPPAPCEDSPMRIHGIDHLVLRVANLQAMLDFYVGALGCSVEKVNEEAGIHHLRAGRAMIDLVSVDGRLGRAGGAAPGQDGHNLDHFCLQVEGFDPDSIATELRSKGLDPEAPVSRFGAQGTGLSIYLKDPEGNVVELKGEAGDRSGLGELPA